MMIPVIYHEDDKIYEFSDISLLYIYLQNTYRIPRMLEENEKVIIVRRNKPNLIIWYEIKYVEKGE